MATLGEWAAGARPRTLPAAVAPVLAGTGAAAGMGSFRWLPALLCALLALTLQIAVNYANDYSDGVRGTDDERRVGPMRLVGSGAATPRAVKLAALATGVVAAALGVLLCWVTGFWWLLGVGALALLATWGYTGGKRPYGYLGLGEVMVFVFFGLVATLGTTYAQAGALTGGAVCAAVAMGSLACALLMVNNLRDVATDTVAGKHTLAVRLGETRARTVFAGMVLTPFACALAAVLLALPAPGMPLALAPLLVLTLAPVALQLARIVRAGLSGPGLVSILRDVGRLELMVGLAFAFALWWGGPDGGLVGG
ncbi:1,4-dihydroxy-2-naphthoate prenyltransferase [Salana multivorans]|uniref:1,4-dihydroxy-2-naphthoate octaprenyltransferase n=1 Tax=Salana multivorans TaxID=120377 RepID=A0A3N2D8Y6_9MICO|nr:1,4-dihydroxy-2-naphthoate polyprenyltransferase [Salana multivorans]OJX93864.1 MAG: 1,4-dihydroxy-2-naphthoate polyprenyltransferase [Micrococcales bacterium 73-15]ROR96088.1 1,4-dihydroxy-2-naphthoate prenyltransferase [Salana multivorans]